MVQIVVVPSAPLNRCCSCGYCVKAVVVSVDAVVVVVVVVVFIVVIVVVVVVVIVLDDDDGNVMD